MRRRTTKKKKKKRDGKILLFKKRIPRGQSIQLQVQHVENNFGQRHCQRWDWLICSSIPSYYKLIGYNMMNALFLSL